jgi:Uma2 family endonuclease
MDDDLPPIDERLVVPEERYEMFDGELVYVSPADPPHGERHLQLAALLAAHVHRDFKAAVDMLTRTSKTDDIAPDVSVFPRAPDPVTGGRQLEHLVFEIVTTTRLSRVSRKSRKLIERGVRRVFMVDVFGQRVLEWTGGRKRWSALPPSSEIVDRSLAVPLSVAALAHTIDTDDDVARALRAKGHAEFQAVRNEALVGAVLAVLAARGVAVDAIALARISDERDGAQLERWLAIAAVCADITALFGTRRP